MQLRTECLDVILQRRPPSSPFQKDPRYAAELLADQGPLDAFPVKEPHVIEVRRTDDPNRTFGSERSQIFNVVDGQRDPESLQVGRRQLADDGGYPWKRRVLRDAHLAKGESEGARTENREWTQCQGRTC